MKTIDFTRRRYNFWAGLYDLCSWPMEVFGAKKWRELIVPKFRGKVLECGVGTGKNIPYYDSEAEVTGVDISSKMLRRAKKLLLTRKPPNIHLKLEDVQKLSEPSDSFDVVYESFVFCSLPDPVQGAKEIQRVLKKDGKAYFLDHVRSKNRVVRWFQNIFNPLTSWVMGFHINRDVQSILRKVGFKFIGIHKMSPSHDLVYLYVCTK